MIRFLQSSECYDVWTYCSEGFHRAPANGSALLHDRSRLSQGRRESDLPASILPGLAASIASLFRADLLHVSVWMGTIPSGAGRRPSQAHAILLFLFGHTRAGSVDGAAWAVLPASCIWAGCTCQTCGHLARLAAGPLRLTSWAQLEALRRVSLWWSLMVLQRLAQPHPSPLVHYMT